MAIVDILRETYPPPVEATGRIFFSTVFDDNLDVVGFHLVWDGGDVLPIAYELLEQLSDHIQRDGDNVTLFGCTAEVVADSPELQTLYVKWTGYAD